MKIDDLDVIVDDEFDHGLSSRLDNVSVIGVTKLEKNFRCFSCSAKVIQDVDSTTLVSGFSNSMS